MNNLMIAQENTINVLFWLCVFETIALSIVAGYFGWKLYGWLEEKIQDWLRDKEPEWKPITLKRGQKDEAN